VEFVRTIKLSEGAWLKVYNDIAQTYPPSVLLIRDRMKSVLGFTSRRHSEWNAWAGMRIEQIHLDFFNERKYTMFILKYSELL
jgi:hypothetical protein